MELRINERTVIVAPEWFEESLLNVLREHLGLVGSKFGCGVGLCGACAVLVDGKPQRSCLLRAKDIASGSITTIEGLAEGAIPHAVQQAWLDEAVPQCGYCQAGQVMATVALLRVHPRPTDGQIDEALSGHLCRCGTQQRIRRAVRRAAGQTP